MTRGRGDVGRERMIKDRQSVECYVCHRLGHKSQVSYKSMARSTIGIFGEPYCRPARGVIKNRRGGTNYSVSLLWKNMG